MGNSTEERDNRRIIEILIECIVGLLISILLPLMSQYSIDRSCDRILMATALASSLLVATAFNRAVHSICFNFNLFDFSFE